MSSALRNFPALPSQLRTYVSVTDAADVSLYSYTVDSEGVWTDSSFAGVTVSNEIYEDLGKVVFHDPVAYAADPTSTPPVDVRKMRVLSTDGLIAVGSEVYLPLGTRVRDTTGMTSSDIPTCWVGLNASGTISLV